MELWPGRFTEEEKYYFHEGTGYETYRKLGAHFGKKDQAEGVWFAVYAPHAKSVSVLVNYGTDHLWSLSMERQEDGVFSAFAEGLNAGTAYMYEVVGADGIRREKADPYGFYAERRPRHASRVWPLDGYQWQDDAYMSAMNNRNIPARPMTVYEVHLGSWKRTADNDFRTYRDLAPELLEYVQYMGYTHVELFGIAEYPFDGSWGYQVTGYFAPTARYGDPDGLKYFIDIFHQAGIGVIIDWVPAHFPKDSFGPEHFDGTTLYEPEDPLKQEYPDWGTYAFDHGKPEVRSFLISNAFYWIREFHADALRVDAVAAMLYASFGRSEFRRNRFGGEENLESIAFLEQLNLAVTTHTHGYLIAEDSSIMQGMTTPVRGGGMGFTLKWNLGWMNDTLRYFETDPLYRKELYGKLTAIADYAFTEHFVNVLSHDEVVHLKRSMLGKMPGSFEDRFGGLKALYTFQYAMPGKKLLFMGQEFGEELEWDENRSLNWELPSRMGHRDIMECVRRLNTLYKNEPVLFSDSTDPATFQWIDCDNGEGTTLAFIRRNPWNYNGALFAVFNLSPRALPGFRLGVPLPGVYRRVFSTYDSLPGGGSPEEIGFIPELRTDGIGRNGRPFSVSYDVRPYECLMLKMQEDTNE